MGSVTGTEPASGPFDESKAEGPRGGEVWALDLGAQAAGHGVRWIRAETHRKKCSPRKVVYCCRRSLLVTRTQTPCACRAPRRVTVTFPGVSRWGQAVLRDLGTQFLTTQSGALGFTGVDDFVPKDDALRIFAEYGK